jgi:uncharacterized integral membrane protein
MLRFIVALILLVLILIFSLFAIINRAPVVVHFDFWHLLLETKGQAQSAFVFQVPLFIIVFVASLLGMLVAMLFPLMGFVRKQRLAYRNKVNQPIKAPPPLEPPPPPPPSPSAT